MTDGRGLGERIVDGPELQLDVLGDVPHLGALVDLVLRIRERVLDGEQRGKRFVVDADERERLFRGALVEGRDAGDFVADEADVVGR